MPTDECKPMRAKKWDELKLEEKVDKLKRTVEGQARALTKMSECLTSLIRHSHADGKVVKELSHPNQEGYGGFYYQLRDLD